MTAAGSKPILFSAPMIRAILAGKKTMTRRILRMPPSLAGADINVAWPDVIFIDGRTPLEWFMQGIAVTWWFVMAGVLSWCVKHSTAVILRYDTAAVLALSGHVP